MSVTPTKICKRGRKAKEGNQNKNCRFCGTIFEAAGRRVSFQNLFSPTSREESPGLILAECCGTIGLPVTKNPNLSERVCIPCSRKIRNAAELYRFVEEAISATEDYAGHAGYIETKRTIYNTSSKTFVRFILYLKYQASAD